MATTTAVKTGRKKEGLLDCLVGLEDAMQKVARLSRDVKGAESVIDEIRSLRSEILGKDKLIAEKDLVHRGLVDQFELKAVEWREENTALQKRLNAMEADQRMTRKLDKALQEASNAKEEAQRKSTELLESKAQVTGLMVELSSTKTQLDDLQKRIGLVEPEAAFKKNIELLANDLYSLASRYGGCAFPEADNNDQLFLSLYDSGFLNVIPQGTPISNSPSSILLRTATMESVITRELTSTIFQELFPWNIAGESIMLARILADCTQADRLKEAIFRALLCSSETQNKHGREASAVSMVSDKVVGVCSPLLDVNDLRSNFVEDLETFLLKAVSFWTSVQRHHTPTIVVSKAVEGAIAWNTRDQYGTFPDEAAGHDPGYPVAVLFPQLYQLLPDGDMDVLHRGYTIWNDQNVYVEAKTEFHAQRHRIDGTTGRSDNRDRRYSTGGHQLRRSLTTRIG